MNEAVFPTVPAAGAARPALSGLAMARSWRVNALDAFPPEAFEEEVVSRRSLGREQVILAKPAAIHHILVDNPQNYSRSAATIRILRPVLGEGLLLSDGEDWARQRHAHAPAFAPRTVPLVARRVGEAAAALDKLDAAGETPIDLLAVFQALTLDAAGRYMLSLDMQPWAAELRELVTAYAEHLGRPKLLDILMPLAIPSPRDLLRRRVRRRWLALLARIIAARRALGETAEGDLFALLEAANAAEGGSETRLFDQVATMLLAGHETTAVALFWATHLVCDRPEVEERILAEARGYDLGPEGAAPSLAALSYTRAVVQETLRLYPPAFAIARVARAADEAGGVAVAKGAVALISPWVLHRHHRLWDDPEVFDPARFLPGAPAPERFHYMPFGAGPRVCIGAQFALTEATLVLARLIRNFRIERTDADPVFPVAIVTTQPDHRPLFRLHRRR